GAVGIVRTPFSGKHRSGSKHGDDYDTEAHFRAPVWCAFAGVGNQRRAHIITRPVVSGHCSILAGPWRSSSSKQRPDKRLKLTGAGFQRKRMFVSKRARTAGEALAPTSARPAAYARSVRRRQGFMIAGRSTGSLCVFLLVCSRGGSERVRLESLQADC